MAEDAPTASESAAVTPERASLERHGIDYDAFQAASEAWSGFVTQLDRDGEPTGPRTEYRSALEAAIHAYLLHTHEGGEAMPPDGAAPGLLDVGREWYTTFDVTPAPARDLPVYGRDVEDWSDWAPAGVAGEGTEDEAAPVVELPTAAAIVVDYADLGFPQGDLPGLPITTDNPYDEDHYCEWCGNGRWKEHGPWCAWADARDARTRSAGMATPHTLRWEMELGPEGYTCHTLEDEHGVRWGWAINAGSTGWAAHVGDFGQAATIGRGAPPLEAQVEQIDSLAEAKAWIEQTIADEWRRG